jgi:hypothetical protein
MWLRMLKRENGLNWTKSDAFSGLKLNRKGFSKIREAVSFGSWGC